MKLHKTKMIVPIVITVIIVLYCVVYFGISMLLFRGLWQFLLGIVPLVLAVVMVKVCIERINEIRNGEEDDISKY